MELGVLGWLGGMDGKMGNLMEKSHKNWAFQGFGKKKWLNVAILGH